MPAAYRAALTSGVLVMTLDTTLPLVAVLVRVLARTAPDREDKSVISPIAAPASIVLALCFATYAPDKNVASVGF
jgi:hypothetical protein